MKTLEEKIEYLGGNGLQITMAFLDALIDCKEHDRSANWLLVMAKNDYDLAKDGAIVDQIYHSINSNKSFSLWKYVRSLKTKSFISGCVVTVGISLGCLALYLCRKEKHDEE